MQRALTPEELINSTKKFTWQNIPEGFTDPVEAVKRAVNDNNDVVIVCGSLYLIGLLKRNLQGKAI